MLSFFPEKKESSREPSGNPEKLSEKTPSLLKPKKVRISKVLSEDVILTAPLGLDKNGLIELLVTRLCEKRELSDPKMFLSKVLEREQGISTTLDTGLSLPHARMDRIKNIVAALALVPQGIVDPKQSDLTIKVMFLFFSSSRQEMLPVHLQLLRGVSSLFQPALIEELAAAADPAAALEMIRRVETQ
ncbi:MAG: PTS sugar transporter subunit IIA [Elusimicrobiota bacterium]|jgi:PTS system nitrogen regulatory IIA component